MDETIKELLKLKNSKLKLRALLLLLKETSGCFQNAKYMFDHRWVPRAADSANDYKKYVDEIEKAILDMFEEITNGK